MVNHKLASFAAVLALWILVTLPTKLIHILRPNVQLHTRQNYAILAAMLRKRTAILSKRFVPVTRAGAFIWKKFHPGYRDLVRKTEISVTGPTRLLIWTHRNFYGGKNGEARSQTEPARALSIISQMRLANDRVICTTDPTDNDFFAKFWSQTINVFCWNYWLQRHDRRICNLKGHYV